MKFILKPWDIRKSRLAAMDMHAAELGASVQGRKAFTGIEQAFGAVSYTHLRAHET